MINSLSNLIVSGQNVSGLKIDEIYKTILEIITKFDETGLVDSDKELDSPLVKNIIESIIKKGVEKS